MVDMEQHIAYSTYMNTQAHTQHSDAAADAFISSNKPNVLLTPASILVVLKQFEAVLHVTHPRALMHDIGAVAVYYQDAALVAWVDYDLLQGYITCT